VWQSVIVDAPPFLFYSDIAEYYGEVSDALLHYFNDIVQTDNRGNTLVYPLQTYPNNYRLDALRNPRNFGTGTEYKVDSFLYDTVLFPSAFINNCYLCRANNNKWGTGNNLNDLGVIPEPSIDLKFYSLPVLSDIYLGSYNLIYDSSPAYNDIVTTFWGVSVTTLTSSVFLLRRHNFNNIYNWHFEVAPPNYASKTTYNYAIDCTRNTATTIGNDTYREGRTVVYAGAFTFEESPSNKIEEIDSYNFVKQIKNYPVVNIFDKDYNPVFDTKGKQKTKTIKLTNFPDDAASRNSLGTCISIYKNRS
jgi:hypothetical protein